MCCIAAVARQARRRDAEEGCGSVSRRGKEEDEVVVEYGIGLLS